jgi:hypothetical protein
MSQYSALQEIEEVTAGSRLTRPSFAYIVHQQNRNKAHLGYRLIGKLGQRRFLESLDVPLASDFTIIGALDDIRPDHLEAPTAIKPSGGSTNRGVMLLVPDHSASSGSAPVWYDLVSRRMFHFEQIRGHLESERVLHRLREPWISEALLERPDGEVLPPDDIKVYAFRGEVAFQHVRTYHPRRHRFFGPDWFPIVVRPDAKWNDVGISPPERREEFIELARNISRVVPLPFIRVDLYDTSVGPVVGELTLLPGDSTTFSDEWDERLGVLYESAEAVLLREALDNARILPEDRHRAALLDEYEATRRRSAAGIQRGINGFV